MGSRIRWWQRGKVYSAVERTVDQQFLFTPNHRRDQPLLRFDCPPDALDLGNDIIPRPSIVNIIGASVGRALEKHPVRLHWLEGNINHLHSGFSVLGDDLGAPSHFKQIANSLIARGVNRNYDREGSVFGARFRAEPSDDDPSAEQQLLYALTNPVKDGLVEKVRQSPYFSCFEHLAAGEPLRFWYLDYTAYEKAGGDTKKGRKELRLKDFVRWTEFELEPLPSQESWSVEQRQTWIRKNVRAVEDACAEERRDAGRRVIGVPALFATNPRSRPENPEKAGPQPLCHASTREARERFAAKWRAFRREHRKASIDYLAGDYEREFPEGSFRPPIATIYQASRLSTP